jgi:hypothetical protein
MIVTLQDLFFHECSAPAALSIHGKRGPEELRMIYLKIK